MNLFGQVTELKGVIESLTPVLHENMITGRVLMYCDLNELKSLLKLSFGQWEILKLLILNLRNLENMNSQRSIRNEGREYNDGHVANLQSSPSTVISQPPPRKQKSIMEKQVIDSLITK